MKYQRIRSVTYLISLALIAVFMPCFGASAQTASSLKRVALVVGNSSYRNVSPLENPAHDAKLMAETLQGLGFELVGGDAQIDLDKPGFDLAVQQFGEKLQGADVGLFYYAGHGIQVRGANYLVPISANPKREADVDFQMLDMALVLKQMDGAGTRLNLVIVDACRNNPFGGRGLRATGGGLAQILAPEGTLISFATQPGNVAQDGSDGDSPYTKALAQTIKKPGLGIFDVFNEVGLAVKKQTGGAQQPWLSSSPIAGSFYFADGPVAQTPPAPAAPTQAQPQVAVLAPPPNKSAIERAPATECDRLAASPIDAYRPLSVPGVSPDKIDAQSAIPACRAALEQYPQEHRFVYTLARALGAGKQYDEAITLYRKAADAGNAFAMNNLGAMYKDGLGVPKNEAEAARLYRKAADAGLPLAMDNLGKMYENGSGVSKDEAEAVHLYRKGAEAGLPLAMVNLGYMLAHGRGVAANDAEALRLYRTAVDAGNAVAMNSLGFMYSEGRGVKRDDVEAARWYRKAADAGVVSAMINLANFYEDGRGVTKDETEAVRLNRKAADAGNALALNNLGRMYEKGRGVPKDDVEAVRLYRKAVDAGFPLAMNNLGVMYEKGSGVPRDYTQAQLWYKKAADLGNEQAKKNLLRLH